MQKNYILYLLSAFLLSLLFYCGSLHGPEMCGDVAANSTIQRIGYNTVESKLSISFINSVSFCTPGLPYQANRLDVSLTDFTCIYQNRKSENQDIFQLLQGSDLLFSGEISCCDSCEIAIPINLPEVSIRYVRKLSGDVVIAIDTNSLLAAEFKIWAYE